METGVKALIIGGVAAGMSAAAKLRRTDPDARVVVYEKGGYLSYGACGLPYFVGGVNSDPSLLVVRTREEFLRQGIEAFLHHEALRVDPARRRVTVRNLESGAVFEEAYDKLMIAVGAESVRLPIPGTDLPCVHHLKTMEDGLRLERAVREGSVREVVIVGGGYIGVETADALLNRGLKVTLLEAAGRILLPFEEEFSAMAARELEGLGVAVRTNEKVAGIREADGHAIVASERAELPADLVVMAVGIRPATAFLQGSGLDMEPNGALRVDREMRASLPDIYAAGDCALTFSRITGREFYLPLATTANKCGRIAGGNMAGNREGFIGALGSAAIKVGSLELARTGLSGPEAEAQGFRCGARTITTHNHPAYYPGQEKITVRLTWEQGTGRVLGACVAGGQGAVLRLGVIAAAIHCGMRTDELGMLDLAYAPPFGGAWDAVHIAANAAK